MKLWTRMCRKALWGGTPLPLSTCELWKIMWRTRHQLSPVLSSRGAARRCRGPQNPGRAPGSRRARPRAGGRQGRAVLGQLLAHRGAVLAGGMMVADREDPSRRIGRHRRHVRRWRVRARKRMSPPPASIFGTRLRHQIVGMLDVKAIGPRIHGVVVHRRSVGHHVRDVVPAGENGIGRKARGAASDVRPASPSMATPPPAHWISLVLRHAGRGQCAQTSGHGRTRRSR